MLQGRTASAIGRSQTVEIGPKRVRDLARARGAAEDRARERIDRRAIGRYQMTPGVGVAVTASDGEREVGHMQRIEKADAFNSVDRVRIGTEAALETSRERVGER